MEDMEKELKRLRTERTHLRRIFSKEAGKFEKHFLSSDIEVKTVRSDFLKLEDKAQRLFKVDSSVCDVLFLSNLAEQEISEEIDKTEEYRDTYFTMVSLKDQLEVLVSSSNEPQFDPQFDRVSNQSESNKHHLKLPKLVPKKFDGSLKEWISFWTTFKRIHESDEFDAETKFQYLLLYTSENSPARQLVESFPPSAGNYLKAVDQLKQRFGREELLVELYSREILKLVLLQAKGEGKLPLRTLYDRLETQIRALETLGMMSDKFSYLLTPLVESALPDLVLKEWERHSVALQSVSAAGSAEKGLEDVDKLRLLLDFIKLEVESEERLSLARDTFAPDDSKSSSIPCSSSTKGNSENNRKKPKVATATDLVNIKPVKNSACIFCGDDVSHASADCFKARERSLEENQSLLKEKGCCFLCMKKGHGRQMCRASLKCIICGGRHVPLLCPKRNSTDRKDNSFEKRATDHNLANTSNELVIMQTLLVRLRGFPRVTARVLFDSGSSRSYITKRLASKLNYTPSGKVELEHALFGGAVSEAKTHACYKVHLESIDKLYACNFDVLDVEEICHAVPSAPMSNLFSELRKHNISLSDHEGGQIDMLIGADIAGKLITGRKVVLSNGLVAFHTHLGWTLMGRIPQPCSQYMSNISLFSVDVSAQNLWKLETIGIEDPAEVLTREQKALAAKEHFLDTVRILEDGRYQVKLPWRGDHPPLQRNFSLAMKRWESTSRKLRTTASETAYADVLMDWLHTGVIEEVPRDEWDSGHYLPHRPVFKENSTTTVRPVFDASAKEKGHPSLNQCLETGPNLIELVPSVLLRFREGKIGLIADIKKAFLQISIDPSDRDSVRFIWKDTAGGLKIFRHARVPFGVCSSPFLLGAVLEHHLDRCLSLVHEGTLSFDKNVIEQLRRCMYVDNYVGSVAQIDDIQPVIDQAKSILALACFDLRGWAHTDAESADHADTPVLGLIWDRRNDFLKINMPIFNDMKSDNISRRMLLSAVQRLYDPIGVVCPVTVIPKKLIQKAWLSGGDWDSPVQEPVREEFMEWILELPALEEVAVPRWLTNFDLKGSVMTLHTFCDASKVAYAAVVFLRVELQGDVHVHFVAAKSRVAPVKTTTIPGLELLAATLGARLCKSVLNVLHHISEAYYWSDSSTALTWIKRDEPWAVFVGNRVNEIRTLSDPSDWRHIPGSFNPADLASRGCSPNVFRKSTWWEGPQWLRFSEDLWPISSVDIDEDEVLLEKRRTIVSALNEAKEPFSACLLGNLMSDYWKILKVIGWVVRFRKNSRRGASKTRGRLTLEELDLAEKWVLRLVQLEAFNGLGDIAIKKLKPQKKEDGLLRVRTKIWARKDSPDFRAPTILPSNHVIVERLILHIHCRNGHVVGQALLNRLRERYWVVRGRQTIRRVLKKCVVCQRFVAQHLDAESPPLPEDRVRDARVFEVTGTDFTGPLYLTDGSKVWICIFTCAIYRAVHLDLVSSLSTEAFMMAFRRFVARRGRPSIMYSDNGTNYKGMANALKTIDWEQISEHSKADQIQWRFNPPTAAWWGGFWERMVQTLKVLLRKILGRSALNFEELYTVVCDCESLINSRPITYVSENVNDPLPISPQMFLQEIMEIGVPDCDQLNSESLNRRIKYRQAKAEELRQRFRVEYLGGLTFTSRDSTNTREPRIGEVVLLGSDNTKRLDWPLAVIEGLTHGKDGRVRLVDVRTAEGNMSRPIQRIYPLEIDCDVSSDYDQRNDDHLEESTISEEEDPQDPLKKTTDEVQPDKTVCNAKTRCGRIVKLPVRYL